MGEWGDEWSSGVADGGDGYIGDIFEISGGEGAMKCGLCRFFEVVGGTGGGVGRCKRWPPYLGFRGRWPEVRSKEGSCGEFKIEEGRVGREE